MRHELGALLIVFVMVGCADEPRPSDDPLQPIATVQEVMDAITIPASDAVWAAAAETPATDEEWFTIRHAALALAESGNLLLMEGRAVDREEWVTETRAFIEAARRAADAASRRSLDDLIEAGDDVYETCLSCHQMYMHPGFGDP